jgi:hypothetical protein
LRDKPREYAAARLLLDGVEFAKVGVKLKGAAGSFREFDDRPGFTVHLGKFGGTTRFHGLQRFHLNNGAQDDSRLSEWVGHEVFTAAGLPAPRVGHALVRVDDRDLGLYVLREAFDGRFLTRTVGHQRGNLYDGGFCQDVDAELEKDSGNGPDDRSDLRALCELCRGVDRDRAAALAAAIDVEHCLDFLALEAMLGHWDGYSLNANNFRLWLPTGGGARFLPHGMDQLFGDAEASILAHPPAIVASAVLQQPTFRKRYRDRLRALLPLFAPARLRPRLDAIGATLQRALRPQHAELADAQREALADLMRRIEARYQSLVDQVKAPEPKPLVLAVGKPLPLKTWHPAAETDHLDLGKKDFAGHKTLFVHCQQRGEEPRHGRFHTRVLLGPGRYQLRGTARCEKVAPPPDDAEGQAHSGVTLRADGAVSARLVGDAAWQPLVAEFEVGDFQRDVELACDVQAFVGRAWFRLDSLQLVRVAN